MGKSEDKIKYKKQISGTARFAVFALALIVAVAALVVVLVVARNSGDGTDSGEPSSVVSSDATDAGDTDDSGDDNGYPENETPLAPDEYQFAAPSAGDTVAVINTSVGTMKFKLFPDTAPKAVANFKAKAEAGYYNGMAFIHLYEDVLQSDGDMDTIYGEGFEREFSINLHNFLGAIGVCNSGDGDTSSNQFYIVTQQEVDDDIISAMSGEQAQSLGLGFSQEVIDKYDSFGGDPTLDGQFAVFGQMFEGFDLIGTINSYEVDDDYKPLQDITIVSVEITTY